jgi:hypothetical protein
MLEQTQDWFGLKSQRLAADAAYAIVKSIMSDIDI